MKTAVTLPQIAAVLETSHNTFRIFWNVARPPVSKEKFPVADTGRYRDAYNYPEVCSYLRQVMPRWNPTHEQKLFEYMREGKHI